VPPLPTIRLDSSHPSAGLDWNTPLCCASHLLVCEGTQTILTGEQDETWDDPLKALEWMASTFPRPGRWVGFLSYDLGRWFEEVPAQALDDLHLPLFAFGFVPQEDSAVTPVTAPSPLASPRALRPSRGAAIESGEVHIQSNFTREEYLRAVARAIDYIAAGDIFQVNLSQRLTLATTRSASTIYDHLLATAPAHYGGLLDFGDFALICNSPELFFRIDPDGRIITRPIKGTRPRRPGMDEALRESIKDQAELNMIVDLERNDLGRICRIGSVRVTEPRVIEAHPTVYHGAATIAGRLREGIGFVEVLRAMFPGGSITGAPKIRAMQIIDELEPHARGPYCGAIGYLDHTGLIEFNIAIRTMTLTNGTAYIPVGGGIVADSSPESEYAETLTKAQALLAALTR
jgi:anthranilate/para-aminobenzoate synthase component I